jgi:hypothetical protein
LEEGIAEVEEAAPGEDDVRPADDAGDDAVAGAEGEDGPAETPLESPDEPDRVRSVGGGGVVSRFS